MVNKASFCWFFLLAVLMIQGVLALTQVFEHSPVNIPEGLEILSNSFSAQNLTPQTDVFLNGKRIGYVGQVVSFSTSDFKAYWEERRWGPDKWRGTNYITFEPDVNNSNEFRLELELRNITSDDGEPCRGTYDCEGSSKCISGYCCSSTYPINFGVTSGGESCASSSIAIHPSEACSNIPSNTQIDFYLGTQKLREDCTIDGDSGWYLIGVGSQCEVPVPENIVIGTYQLKAVYTIEGVLYTQIINPTFKINSVCSANSPCAHGGYLQMGSQMTMNFNATEQRVDMYDSARYTIPINSVAEMKDISMFVAQCSNGVVSNSQLPGVVTWTLDSRGDSIARGNNYLFSDCSLPDSRTNYVGPSSSTIGHIPTQNGGGTCDISWNNQGTYPKASIATFNVAGNYTVFTDYINAVCDSPDYICSDLFGSRKKNTCSVGTMAGDYVADGFSEYKQYSVKVVSPKISFTRAPIYSMNGMELTQILNIKNTGVGNAIMLNGTSNLGDLTYSIDSIAQVAEGQVRDVYPVFRFSSPVNKSRSNVVTSYGANYTLSSFNYSEYSLNNYTNYSFVGDKLIVNYNFPNPLRYDDDYGFNTIAPTSVEGNVSFNFTFTCNLESHYVINLKGQEFLCISDVYWANMNWKKISEADLGDAVKLVYTNSKLVPGEEVVFEIYYKDGATSRAIRTVSLNSSLKGIVDSGENVYTYWIITQADLDRADDNDLANFYFVVNGKESGMLKIGRELDDTPMDIRVVSPSCGIDVFEGTIIPVNISASDEDTLILGEVTIDEPNDVKRFNFTNGGVFFNYSTLGNSGNVQIVVFGTNEKGYLKRVISSIMVVSQARSDSYIAACIDKPADFSDIGSGEVKFEAISSRGLRYNPAGSGSKIEVTKSELNFFWTFSDGSINPNTDGANPLSYNFWKIFIEAGHNWATLEVEYKG